MISSRALATANQEQQRGVTIFSVAAMLITYLVIYVIAPPQTLAAVIFGVVMGTLVVLRPSTGVGAVLAYLMVMGDVRRYLVSENASIPSNDPLLAVGPAMALLLIVLALKDNQLNLRTREAKLVLIMMFIMTLEIINPLQGGITVGLQGVLFNMIPLAWFWIGQSYGIPATVEKIFYRVLIPLAVVASILGMTQQLVGFLGFEARWFRISAVEAIRPDMRPFSFFSSWAEYPFFIAIALVAAVAPLFQRRIRASLLLVPLFIAAMLVQSVREAIFGATFALAVLWAVQGRTLTSVGTRLSIAIVLAAASLVAGMTVLKSADLDVDKNTQTMLEHTTDGVLDIGNSTAGGHLELVGAGIWSGITHPAGLGTGANTAAARALGDIQTSEIDFSDSFIAFGVFGVIYVYLLYCIVSTSIVSWRTYREPIALLGLGVMVSQLGHWGQGGLYAVSALSWYSIGTLDRLRGQKLVALSVQPKKPAAAATPRMPARSPAWRPVPTRRPMFRPNNPIS